MSELFHNLSWQAIDNDRYQIQFDSVSRLTLSINQRLQKLIMEHRRKTNEINNEIISQLMSKEVVDDKSDIEKIEQNIVKDIINGDKTEYGRPSPPPFPKTEQQVDDNRIEETKENLKTELAKNQRDFEIIDGINAKNKVDLIKSAIVPIDGELTNEEIISADYTKMDNNEPLKPTLDPTILKIMQEIVRNSNAFVNETNSEVLPQITFDENEPPKPPPKIKTEPTLQEILTEPEESDVVTELVKVKNEVMPESESICLDFPEQTGIRSVDKRNYQEWLDTLEVIRPDLFIDKEDNYTDEPQVNILVPTDITDGLSNVNEKDIVAQPKVETIILPQPKVETPPFFDPREGCTFAPIAPLHLCTIATLILKYQNLTLTTTVTLNL